MADAAGACGLAADQRGLPRNDGACDSGAFELGPIAAIPPPIPDGQFASPLRVANPNEAGTAIDVTWNVGLCPSRGYHLIYGDLSNVAAYTIIGSECGLGFTGSATDIPVPPGDLWLLVLANNVFIQTEGSWGQATSGERNGTTASAECGFVVRDNSGTCP